MNRSEAEDDRLTTLALAARAGDRAALEGFISGTQRDVWRFVAHLTSVPEAEDLTQETYLRACKSLRRFAGRSSARSWLLSIARRVAADHIRRLRSRPRISTEDEGIDVADRHGANAGFEDVVELNVLLDGLDHDRREALLLTQVFGMSYREAAGVCGCAEGTIRSRVARAREELLNRSGQRSEDIG